MNRWLQKIIATLTVRFGLWIAKRVDTDIMCGITQQEIQKHTEDIPSDVHLITGSNLSYDRLKEIENEWVDRKIIN